MRCIVPSDPHRGSALSLIFANLPKKDIRGKQCGWDRNGFES